MYSLNKQIFFIMLYCIRKNTNKGLNFMIMFCSASNLIERIGKEASVDASKIRQLTNANKVLNRFSIWYFLLRLWCHVLIGVSGIFAMNFDQNPDGSHCTIRFEAENKVDFEASLHYSIRSSFRYSLCNFTVHFQLIWNHDIITEAATKSQSWDGVNDAVDCLTL